MLNIAGRVGLGRVGSGQEVSQSRGSHRIRSRGFEILRFGPGQEVRKSPGAGRVMTRDIWVNRESSHHDPRAAK